jgi:hypothetical protein
LNLRLVCTKFNLIAEPEALSCLVFDERTLVLGKSQLEMFANGLTRATLHARTLKIKCLRLEHPQSGNDHHLYEANMKEYLGPAISSLKKLQRVMYLLPLPDSSKSSDPVVHRWSIDREPMWAANITIDALASLPFLEDFELRLAIQESFLLPVASFCLDRLSGLKRLKLDGICGTHHSRITAAMAEVISKSPDITQLEVNTDAMYLAPEEAPSLHELVARVPPSAPLHLTHLILHEMYCRIDAITLPHLRSLSFLAISDLLDPNIHPWIDPPGLDDLLNRVERYSSSVSDAFAVLNRENIHLRGIVINEVNSTILSYLESYSGLLQHLVIDTNGAEETDALAERFFSSVLPRHVASIIVLGICPCLEGKWCYDNRAAAVLLQCKRLSSLTIVLPSSTLDESFPSWPVRKPITNFDDMVCVII